MATRVGTGVTGSSNGVTTVVASAKATTTGNFLIAGVKTENTVSLSSITDTAGNTWTILPSASGLSYNGGACREWLAYAPNIQGSGWNVVTATFSGGGAFADIIVEEFSGLAHTSATDGSTQTNTGTTADYTTADITTTRSGLVGLAVGDFAVLSNLVGTPGNPDFSASPLPSSGSSAFFYLLSGSAQTVTPGGGADGNSAWGAVAQAFKDANRSAALTGSATSSITESDIVTGGKQVVLTLTDDMWVPEQSGEIIYVGSQLNSFAGKTGETLVAFALTGGAATQPAAGDLVVISYAVGSTADRTLAISQGTGNSNPYTLIGSELYSNDTYDVNLRVAYRFMPATPDTSFYLGGTGSIDDAGAYSVHVFRGVDSTTPLDVTPVTATGIDSRVANPGSITPTTAGSVLLVVGAAAAATGGTYTASYLSDFRAKSQADVNDVQIGSGYRKWTTGAYDPAAFSAGGTSTTNDSWAAMTIALRPALTTPFADQRANIRNGLDSAQSEAGGWDAKVKGSIPVANVVRNSNTQVTITLQAQSDYDITATETITATIPATALASGSSLVASPTFTIAPASSGPTGTLSVTEASDTGSFTGTTSKNGTLAVTEAQDTLSASGLRIQNITGTLSITEAKDTGSFSGTAYKIVSGTASITEAKDTGSFTGDVSALISGSLTITEASDTFSASGSVTQTVDVTGTLVVTESQDTVSISGEDRKTGTFSVTESADSFASIGSAYKIVSGSISITEAQDAISASGSASSGSQTITGSFSITEAQDAFSSTASHAANGTLSITEAQDTGNFSGSVVATITGTFAVSEAGDTVAMVGINASATFVWVDGVGTSGVSSSGVSDIAHTTSGTVISSVSVDKTDSVVRRFTT